MNWKDTFRDNLNKFIEIKISTEEFTDSVQSIIDEEVRKAREEEALKFYKFTMDKFREMWTQLRRTI